MVEQMLIDLKSLLVEREDCDAGTVTKLREGLAQGKTQYRTLREVTETLKKRAEAATGASTPSGTLIATASPPWTWVAASGPRASSAQRRACALLKVGSANRRAHQA